MYDPKFEKAVQQKMEELEFRPSESVWVNIEKAVAGERRRRVIPYLWRWLATALLLTGIAGAWYFGERAGKRMVVTVSAGPVASSPAGQAVSPPAGPVASSPAGQAVSPPAGPVASSLAGQAVSPPAGQAVASSATKVGAAATVLQGARTNVDRHRPSVVRHTPATIDNRMVTADGGDGRESVTASEIAPYLYNPDPEGRRMAPRVSAAEPGTSRNTFTLHTLSRPQRPWEAGFMAGTGIDHLNQLNAGGANNPAASFGVPLYYSLASNARIYNSVSEVRPDVSFEAGVYLQKPVSGRWTFNTGLDLHYYSSLISIGQQLNTIAPSSASLIAAPSAIAVAQAPAVYTVGDQHSYTNRYYTLELPVGMQYRINRSRMLPLFLEGGLSLSRIMGANALFYDPSTGLYAKNENALNKTQIDLSSALMIGLPFHGIRIKTGPQVQYGLTRLLASQSLGDQHFIYTGIRVVVLPGRR